MVISFKSEPNLKWSKRLYSRKQGPSQSMMYNKQKVYLLRGEQSP